MRSRVSDRLRWRGRSDLDLAGKVRRGLGFQLLIEREVCGAAGLDVARCCRVSPSIQSLSVLRATAQDHDHARTHEFTHSPLGLLYEAKELTSTPCIFSMLAASTLQPALSSSFFSRHEAVQIDGMRLFWGVMVVVVVMVVL